MTIILLPQVGDEYELRAGTAAVLCRRLAWNGRMIPANAKQAQAPILPAQAQSSIYYTTPHGRYVHAAGFVDDTEN